MLIAATKAKEHQGRVNMPVYFPWDLQNKNDAEEFIKEQRKNFRPAQFVYISGNSRIFFNFKLGYLFVITRFSSL